MAHAAEEAQKPIKVFVQQNNGFNQLFEITMARESTIDELVTVLNSAHNYTLNSTEYCISAVRDTGESIIKAPCNLTRVATVKDFFNAAQGDIIGFFPKPIK